MSADKRSVSTDALETLGTIISENEKRDAIHLAVEPVIAGQALAPGQDIGIVEGRAYTRMHDKAIGIVDPFLTDMVQPGERFWLVIYPRKINSLRHVWSHPNLPDEPIPTYTVSPAPVIENVPVELRLSESEQWIADYAATIPLTYDILMSGAREWLDSTRSGGFGEYLCFGSLLEGASVPDEFWDHYEKVAQEEVLEADRGSFFTCSC